MEGRNGFHKTGRLMSSQLEQELAGFEERGLRSSKTRLPAKSYLPKVLLSSNPLVERDLQKTLTQIHLGQTRRQKIWEWNQRHFFVSQIFDPEYNLRFTRGLTRYSTDLSKRDILHSRRPSRFRNNDHADEVADENIVGLGVFMPPLHPSQRLIEKQKIPSSGSKAKQGLIGTVSSPDLSYGKEQVVNGSGQKIYREKHINNLEVDHKSSSKDATRSKNNNVRQRRVTLASAKCTASTGKLQKAASLPEIPIYRPVTFESQQKSSLDQENSPPQNREKLSRQYSQQEILCHDHVIVNLTRSLPLSVMIKANQNINKVVQKRKALMIERCRTARDRNTFEDPRWKELESVLEASDST